MDMNYTHNQSASWTHRAGRGLSYNTRPLMVSWQFLRHEPVQERSANHERY